MAKSSSVLEIGSGWGPLSVFCASRFKANVTALDIDPEVFPFLEVLAELNEVEVETLVKGFDKLKQQCRGNRVERDITMDLDFGHIWIVSGVFTALWLVAAALFQRSSAVGR